MRIRALALTALTVLAATSAACSADSTDDTEAAQNNAKAPLVCAAMRGNGELIITHFAALSRIVEQYGVVGGMAGGSSGSISTFFYESMLMNPDLKKCDPKAANGEACEKERAAQVALLLKSIQGYAAVLGNSAEAKALMNLAQTAKEMQAAVKEQGPAIDANLAANKIAEAKANVETALQATGDLRPLINPEILAGLQATDPARLKWNISEIRASAAVAGSFDATDNHIFFRPGILNWDMVATLLGRVADFYAGYAPAPALGTWLTKCAPLAAGKTWSELAGSAPECTQAFTNFVTDYRAKAASAKPRRPDEMIGNPASPLRKLVTTSVLHGAAAAAYAKTKEAYQTSMHGPGPVDFKVNFDDVKFGYWGSTSDMQRAGAGGDAKSKKFLALGNQPWRVALRSSPAEPGLSRFVELDAQNVSAGGWSDLAPVLVLKNIGCQNVIYVTREGAESSFAQGTAKNLGMDEGARNALFELTNASSGFAASIAKADGVWCTNWDHVNGPCGAKPTQEQLVQHTYNQSPFEARSAFLKGGSYKNMTPSAGRPGCTPGVAAQPAPACPSN